MWIICHLGNFVICMHAKRQNSFWFHHLITITVIQFPMQQFVYIYMYILISIVIRVGSRSVSYDFVNNKIKLSLIIILDPTIKWQNGKRAEDFHTKHFKPFYFCLQEINGVVLQVSEFSICLFVKLHINAYVTLKRSLSNKISSLQTPLTIGRKMEYTISSMETLTGRCMNILFLIQHDIDVEEVWFEQEMHLN